MRAGAKNRDRRAVLVVVAQSTNLQMTKCRAGSGEHVVTVSVKWNTEQNIK